MPYPPYCAKILLTSLYCLSSPLCFFLPLASLLRGCFELLSLCPEFVGNDITEVLYVLEAFGQRSSSSRRVYKQSIPNEWGLVLGKFPTVCLDSQVHLVLGRMGNGVRAEFDVRAMIIFS